MTVRRAVGATALAVCAAFLLVARTGTDSAGSGRGESEDCPVGPAISDGDLVSVARLAQWTEEMNDVGFRHVGSRAHRRYIDSVADRLAGYGLTVQRHPTPLDYWEATAWSLEVTDALGQRHEIPVAYYRPYSGETPPQGVTAQVVDVGAADAAGYGSQDVRGRIVLADLDIAELNTGVLEPLTHYAHPPDGQEALRQADYSRIWLGIPGAPDLADTRQRGAVALIDVLDMPPELAQGQFYPHQQVYAGLPALHLDRAQGARLRELLSQGPVTATVRLTATKERTTVDYLTAELPGSGPTDGAVMVLTHTDGQNAVEENGVPAVLAMAEYFTRFSPQCRSRDIFFVLSAVHMTAHDAATHSDVFLTEHPEISGRVAAALVPEHLGATEWVDDRAAGRYRATGAAELMAVPVGHSQALTDLAIDEVRASDLPRTAVLKPFQDGLYGEGTGPYRVGIPTIGFIGGPTYLLQVTPDGEIDKIDHELMHRQTAFLTRLLARMLELPDFG